MRLDCAGHFVETICQALNRPERQVTLAPSGVGFQNVYVKQLHKPGEVNSNTSNTFVSIAKG